MTRLRTKRHLQEQFAYEDAIKNKRPRWDHNGDNENDGRIDQSGYDFDNDFNNDDFSNNASGEERSAVEQIDDLNMLAISQFNHFTHSDQQLILLHSFLKSSMAEKQFFDLFDVFETVSSTTLPLDRSSAMVLKRDLKNLWDIKCAIYCPNCFKKLKGESSKCKNSECESAVGSKNVIICTCDARQQLLHIVHRYYDFSEVEDGQNVFISLTINTDGFIPKGHSTKELWPVFMQVANLPDAVKATHGSVALVAVVVDNGKPSETSWEFALTPTVDWLENQENGLKLNLSPFKSVQVFFQIENLSADLAACCHVYSFSTWASSDESCFKCYVKPIREHGAQRFDLVGPFERRTNISTAFDIIRRRRGFKNGSTFWMRLVSILNYRFDSLHKICEGVCAMLLKECFGSTKARLGRDLRYRRKDTLLTSISKINWPQSCRLYFDELFNGTATQRLGAFIVGVPMAILDSNISSSMAIFMFGLVAVISRVFTKTFKIFGKKEFLNDLARLQEKLCGTKFSTLKFHHFYEHPEDDEESENRCSTFVFESLNRCLKLHFSSHHANGFAAVVLERFLLERLVLLHLERRSSLCEEVSKYVSKHSKEQGKNDVKIGYYYLKGEESTSNGTKYYQRYSKHKRIYSIFDNNQIYSRVTVHYKNSICFGELIKVYQRRNKLKAKILLFSTENVINQINSFAESDDETITEASNKVKETLEFIIDEHVQIGANGPRQQIKTDLDNVVGHCLVAEHASYMFFFNIALKAECK